MTLGDISPIIKERRYDLEKFTVEFFRKEDGSCPTEDFIESLDVKMRAKFLRLLLLLENNGNELREPHSKPIEDGIFELRVKQGSNIARALYFFVVGHKIVITNGFIKKTQKTPSKEIEMAKKYRDVYMKGKEL